TLALLLPEPKRQAPERSLAEWIEEVLLPVAGLDPADRCRVIKDAWCSLPFDERLVFNKLLTGALRVGCRSARCNKRSPRCRRCPLPRSRKECWADGLPALLSCAIC